MLKDLVISGSYYLLSRKFKRAKKRRKYNKGQHPAGACPCDAPYTLGWERIHLLMNKLNHHALALEIHEANVP